MRYTTPLWVRPTGYYNNDGNYVRTGSREEVGVPLPNPGARPPSAGHWRTSPLGKLRMPPRKHVEFMWRADMRPSAHDDMPSASVRARVRAAVAAGVIAPADAPSWAQPQ